MRKLLLSAIVFTALASCKDDDKMNNQDVNYARLPQEFLSPN